jgi:hypothetical protein
MFDGSVPRGGLKKDPPSPGWARTPGVTQRSKVAISEGHRDGFMTPITDRGTGRVEIFQD